MKKITTITFSVIAGSVLAYNAYSLTCAQQPTCESLGYTLTSTSDCIGTVLKCPFNTARYYCTTKTEALNKLTQDIVTAAMPDYKNVTTVTCGKTYTALTDGYLIGSERFWDNWSNCKQFSGVTVTINNYNARLTGAVHGNFVNTWSYPVKKGHQYYVSCPTCNNGSDYAEYYYSFVAL